MPSSSKLQSHATPARDTDNPIVARVGLISDTHDTLPPEVLDTLAGCNHIIHAGDVTSLKILRSLERIAPVTMARGNCDWSFWAEDKPYEDMVEIGGVNFLVIHDLDSLDMSPAASGIDVVVFGHTHKAQLFSRQGVTYVNPGSPSHPRGGMKPSVAIAEIRETGVTISHFQV